MTRLLSRHILLPLLALLLPLASCTKEVMRGSLTPAGDMVPVTIRFQVTGSEVLLRATEAGTAEESIVTTADLYYTKGGTNPVQKISVTPTKVDNNTFTATVMLESGVPLYFKAVANAPTSVSVDTSSWSTMSGTLVTGSVAPASPFLM